MNVAVPIKGVETFLDGKITLLSGDCLDLLKTLPDASVDAVVSDPPYHLTTGIKGGTGTASLNPNSPAGRARISTGFMGRAWDGGDIAFRVELWREVLRVLKPGGHLCSFSGTRTYHRMACAIEDAGFEIRDQIGWAFGQGFPKSLDISKAIDKAAGAERKVVGSKAAHDLRNAAGGDTLMVSDRGKRPDIVVSKTRPASEAAIKWQGFGTALKPAWEPICLARKPLIGTVAENVLQHGTGALNIDGCRAAADWANDPTARGWQGGDSRSEGNIDFGAAGNERVSQPSALGRWPANVVHDGSDDVLAAFPSDLTSGQPAGIKTGGSLNCYGHFNGGIPVTGFGDSGSAARFYYTAKADADDRIGSKHPTVKPVDLMQWLVRLVTPPGGLVLDPFSGTGTTGEAAWREGMRATLIEREAEYQDDIRRRMALCVAGPEERKRESMKAKMKDKPIDNAGTLFA